jgi:tRNA(Ile)-lysidine synthase
MRRTSISTGKGSTSKPRVASLPLETSLLKPGLRLAVGVSGGADSVALLRSLADRSRELGLVLQVAHLHHGLRGAEADADLEFARTLAADLGLSFHEARVDTSSEAAGAGESIEEAARRLRHAWFRQLLASDGVDAVATAHTRDDQAETVLAKFLRGAWTEGLSGIHPVVEFPEGPILRPLLGATRAEVEAYLNQVGQAWRDDSSNREVTFTRNRIRHELLPLLETWNPQLREHLAQMAVLARDEEGWWSSELDRLTPQLLLSGRPVRGGGRASGEGLALDVTRLAAFAPAVQRRLLRRVAAELDAALDFPATESLRTLALTGKSGQKIELAQGLRAERTPREIRFFVAPGMVVGASESRARAEYQVTIPGEITAQIFDLRVRIEFDRVSGSSEDSASNQNLAVLRNWKPGDRVQLRHSSGPRKVKEVLERLRITGTSRALWPVLEVGGRIVWMKGVEVEPVMGINVFTTNLEDAEIEPV